MEPTNGKFKQTSDLFPSLDHLSFAIKEGLFVLDIQRKQFYFVERSDLFLCGFSAKNALKIGYEFYLKIIHPEDLSLWTDMNNAIFQYLKEVEETQTKIDSFCCTYRLQRNYGLKLPRPLPQMIYRRMQPVWKDGKVRYLICSINTSTCKKVGNLHIYYKDEVTYKEYNLSSGCWEQKTKVLLTKREKEILTLVEQGKNPREIADYLCRGYETVRNQITSIYSKLDVHSMPKALEVAKCLQLY